MLLYPCAISLSTRTLNYLADRIRALRREQGSRWRRLDPGRQALLALARLRNNDTYAYLADGFTIGLSTAWRYVREAVDLLAASAPDLTTVMKRIRRLSHVILDGTLIPMDRVYRQKPYFSGKHRRHGVNIQTIADGAGRLIWASPALPGAVFDVKAARIHGIIEALTNANVITFGDMGYQGAGGTVITPYKRHKGRRVLNAWHKTFNRTHAKIRCRGERANATLKQWKILTKIRCSPCRITPTVQAILVLHHIEAGPHPR